MKKTINLKTCIIIPCYNEEKRLKLDSFVNYIDINTDVNICFVNDGSTDNTENILKYLKTTNNRINYINNSTNLGKAESVRNGIILNLNKYDYLAFLDADLATPLEELNRIITFISSSKYQVVFGSRILKLGSNIKRRFKRHVFGRLFATTIDLLFKIKAYDTQCGAKIFSNKIAEIIFKDKFTSKWIFDVELLIRIRKINQLDKVCEIPLNNWEDIKGSKIKFIDMVKLPIEISKLYLKYR